MGKIGIVYNTKTNLYNFFMAYTDENQDKIYAVLTKDGWKKATVNKIPVADKIKNVYLYKTKKKIMIDFIKLKQGLDQFLEDKQ
jgi:DNA polymerase III sliding clamp (beta) subunit (PCNA family)